MTIQIIEKLGSRTFSSSGGHTASRIFVCYDDEVDMVAEAVDILLDPQMPTKGQSHPDAENLLADTYTMTPSDEGIGVWEVTWEYNPYSTGSGGDNPLQPDEVASVGLSIDSAFAIVDLYKSGFSLSAINIDDPDPDPENPLYITGTLEALMGNPISKAVPQTTINITEEIETNSFQMVHHQNAGKRNLNSWLGLPAGSVVFAGISVSRSGVNKYKVSYKFVYDAWYHLRQIPRYDANGKVDYDNSVSPPTQPVSWRQPFKETIEFGFQPSV